jgi:hypothetical protein
MCYILGEMTQHVICDFHHFGPSFRKWVSKSAEFLADFESVEKVLKKCTIKKLLAKM